MTASVRPDVLLTGFQTDWGSLTFDALLGAALVAYVAGARTLARRGRRWRSIHSGCFVAGLLCLFVAIGSGLATYDDVDPAAHVVQHWLLMMVGAPLLVLGRPVTLAAQSAPRGLQSLVVRSFHSRAGAVLLGGGGAVLYVATMPAYFLTGWYSLSIRSTVVHLASHAWFLAVGLLYAASLFTPELTRRSVPIRRVLLVVLTMPFEAGVGIALAIRPSSLVAGEGVGATHLAGVAFLVTSMIASGLALAIVLGQWAIADERRVRRLEGRPAADAVPSAVRVSD